MARGRSFAMFLTLCLMADAFCVPAHTCRWQRRLADNQLNSRESSTTNGAKDSKESNENHTTTAIMEDKIIKDDFDDLPQNLPPSSVVKNIASLMNSASALFPSSGSAGNNAKNNNLMVKKLIQDFMRINRSRIRLINKRQDIADNVIEIEETADLKPPPFQKQEIDETEDSDSADSSGEDSDEANKTEESFEKEVNASGNSNSKQVSEQGSNGENDDDDDDNDSDYDDPPPGDGQGGGILGLLAGLSGDGDSDLGSLLATIGGIVASLSGDGVDINAIIATGLGLFVGLLSEGEQNPGEIIASYLLTSLDTITGGGAKNNGAFFGKFITKLVKGTSAGGDPDAESGSEENKMTMADSGGFFASLLMALLGEMSKTSSGGSWR